MLPKKVLIVDDEKSLSELIMESLNLVGGFIVERAFNGKEAVEKYKAFAPDIVVMDVEMPVMDGYDLFLQVIRVISGLKGPLMKVWH